MNSSTDRSSNRPEKTVYSITSKGKKAFQLLLSEALDLDYRPTFPLDAGLYFFDVSLPGIDQVGSERTHRKDEGTPWHARETPDECQLFKEKCSQLKGLAIRKETP